MHFPVTEVLFGSKALRDTEYANRRAEMWGEMRKWLQTGCLPDDRELADDLTGPEYSFVRENVIQLERKADMKLRGLASPDTGDALALTFAQPVRSRASNERDGTLCRQHDISRYGMTDMFDAPDAPCRRETSGSPPGNWSCSATRNRWTRHHAGGANGLFHRAAASCCRASVTVS